MLVQILSKRDRARRSTNAAGSLSLGERSPACRQYHSMLTTRSARIRRGYALALCADAQRVAASTLSRKQMSQASMPQERPLVVASMSARATTSTRGCWRAILAITFRASPRSWCRTSRRRLRDHDEPALHHRPVRRHRESAPPSRACRRSRCCSPRRHPLRSGEALWLGQHHRETHVTYVWHTSPVQSLDELKTKQLIVGAQAPGSSQVDFPLAANALFASSSKSLRVRQHVQDSTSRSRAAKCMARSRHGPASRR